MDRDTQPGDIDAHKRRRIIFDPTINLGHVLSFVGFLLIGAAAYFDLRRVDAVHELRFVQMEKEDAAERTRTVRAFDEVKGEIKEVSGDVKDVRKGVERLLERRP